jgi:class 3 adenylate cyclase
VLGGDPRFGTSEVRYAQADDAHLAYRVIAGANAPDRDVVLVLVGTMPMDALFEDPVARRLLDGLADLGRLVMFDRRGIGLSDPPTDSTRATFADWRDDLEAVVAAAQVRRPVLVTNLSGSSAVLLYASRHPEVESIVFIEPSPPVHIDYQGSIRDQVEGRLDPVSYIYPSRADEPGFRAWFKRAGQLGAGPRMAERAYPVLSEEEILEIRQAASKLHLPVLVLRRPASPLSPDPAADPIMALVDSAVRVDLPGVDIGAYGGEVDALLAEVFRFVTGEHRTLAPERVLAAVLYTDLVASTRRAVELGDARWKRVLDRHDEIARRSVGRRGGTVIKSTGDGFVAILPSAANALDAAREVRDTLAHEDLEVRAGIHVGDVDRRGDDISGVAVAIAARLLALAGPGDILLTGGAVGATVGQSVHYEPRGEHRLKGVPGTWPVFSAVVPAPTQPSRLL